MRTLAFSVVLCVAGSACGEPQRSGIDGGIDAGGEIIDPPPPDVGPPDGPPDAGCAPTACPFDACGPISDGCGGEISCGECAEPDVCGGAGRPAVCGSTPPMPTCAPATFCRVTYPAAGNLTAIWGSSTSDVWITSGRGRDLSDGIAHHWDGTRWSAVAAAIGSSLFAVWGASSDDVWAVGDDVVVRWNGGTWAPHPVPMSSGGFYSVWGSSPDDIWIGGDAALFRATGSTWITMNLPYGIAFGARVLALRGFTADDVWASGDAPSVRSWIGHWDGAHWQNIHEPSGVLYQVADLWGASTNDMWFVGRPMKAARFSLLAWRVYALSGEPRAVWGASADDAWIVGESGYIAHWDGVSWTTVESGTTEHLNAVWGIDGEVWVAGNAGLILHRRP